MDKILVRSLSSISGTFNSLEDFYSKVKEDYFIKNSDLKQLITDLNNLTNLQIKSSWDGEVSIDRRGWLIVAAYRFFTEKDKFQADFQCFLVTNDKKAPREKVLEKVLQQIDFLNIMIMASPEERRLMKKFLRLSFKRQFAAYSQWALVHDKVSWKQKVGPNFKLGETKREIKAREKRRKERQKMQHLLQEKLEDFPVLASHFAKQNNQHFLANIEDENIPSGSFGSVNPREFAPGSKISDFLKARDQEGGTCYAHAIATGLMSVDFSVFGRKPPYYKTCLYEAYEENMQYQGSWSVGGPTGLLWKRFSLEPHFVYSGKSVFQGFNQGIKLDYIIQRALVGNPMPRCVIMSFQIPNNKLGDSDSWNMISEVGSGCLHSRKRCELSSYIDERNKGNCFVDVISRDRETYKNYETGGHAVVIIGQTERAYIVKNSWGLQFGNQGYFLIDKYQNSMDLWDSMKINIIDTCWRLEDIPDSEKQEFEKLSDVEVQMFENETREMKASYLKQLEQTATNERLLWKPLTVAEEKEALERLKNSSSFQGYYTTLSHSLLFCQKCTGFWVKPGKASGLTLPQNKFGNSCCGKVTDS